MTTRFCLAALAFLAAGCSISIDERTVFAPQEPEFRAGTEADMKIWMQEVFTEPTNYTIEVDVNGERTETTGRKADFAPATVEHGFLPYGEGERLAWTLISREGEGRPLVTHCGGNASDRYRSGTVYALKAIDFGDVLVFDYPGYGDSSGGVSTGAMEAARIALAGFIETRAQGRPVVFWGHSLGGFVCAELVGETADAAAMVFETSARNPDEVAKAWKPWYLPFLSIRVDAGLAGYDNVAALAGFDGPVLVLGAKKDRTLPVRLSRSLAAGLEAEGVDVSYVEFPEAGHNNVPGSEGFRAAIAAFFARVAER